MTNASKIIICLLIAVITLTACGTVKDASVNSSAPTIRAENTCVKRVNDLSDNAVSTESDTPSDASPSSDEAPPRTTSSEAPKEPLPPSEDSQPTPPPESDTATLTDTAPPTETVPPAETVETQRPLLEMELEAVRLVNAEREKVGLAPLVIDDTYYNLVKLRADECVEYWSHTRPNGQKWSSVYDGAQGFNGIRKIGENLGKNFMTVAQITEALMNSDGHRAAILGADYTHICIAITVMNEGNGNDPLYAITQHFYKRED